MTLRHLHPTSCRCDVHGVVYACLWVYTKPVYTMCLARSVSFTIQARVQSPTTAKLRMTDPYFIFLFYVEDPDNQKPILYLRRYFSVYFVRLVYIYLYVNLTDIITN